MAWSYFIFDYFIQLFEFKRKIWLGLGFAEYYGNKRVKLMTFKLKQEHGGEALKAMAGSSY